jgi:hypothetical protein
LKKLAAATARGHRRQAEPDWAAVHRELKRKHVALSILWEEYIASDPGGYRYLRFCELYRAWGPAVRDDAPVTCGRRQAVGRLCRLRRAGGASSGNILKAAASRRWSIHQDI